jgi:hypothetical protein
MSGVSTLVGAAGRGDVAAVRKALKLRLSVDGLHEVCTGPTTGALVPLPWSLGELFTPCFAHVL